MILNFYQFFSKLYCKNCYLDSNIPDCEIILLQFQKCYHEDSKMTCILSKFFFSTFQTSLVFKLLCNKLFISRRYESEWTYSRLCTLKVYFSKRKAATKMKSCLYISKAYRIQIRTVINYLLVGIMSLHRYIQDSLLK